jgi:hypothetical protein
MVWAHSDDVMTNGGAKGWSMLETLFSAMEDIVLQMWFSFTLEDLTPV